MKKYTGSTIILVLCAHFKDKRSITLNCVEKTALSKKYKCVLHLPREKEKN